MGKVIEVNKLCFGYSQKLILQDVSFSVDRGDFIGIIGSNGSGKSTLIKLLLKILTPVSGEIRILNEDIQKYRQWQKIGYVSQKANSFNTGFPATVEEVVGANLFSTVGLGRALKRHHKQQIHKALEYSGIYDLRRKLVGDLSGGQQQRVFIARALVGQPEILFMDEPTVGIDAKTEEALYCLLAKLNKELGITIVMITHDISEILVHANKLACISDRQVHIYNSDDGMTDDCISQIFGQGIHMHINKHDCLNCKNKERFYKNA